MTFLVPDYDQGIAFFVGRLGWYLAADEDHGAGKRWVMVEPPGGGTALLLARASGPDQTAAIGRQAGGRVGFFLWAENFGTTHARMLAAGIPFEEPPRSEPYGTVAVWRDPWGNRWDLLGPP
ncbi:MAG TPA: VOC family protein [Rubellimicrobium sp.]|nr:VOC family protein [Rubellimicrobium sp.]